MCVLVVFSVEQLGVPQEFIEQRSVRKWKKENQERKSVLALFTDSALHFHPSQCEQPSRCSSALVTMSPTSPCLEMVVGVLLSSLKSTCICFAMFMFRMISGRRWMDAMMLTKDFRFT